MSHPHDDEPDSITAAHLAGEAFTEAITDQNRARLTTWNAEGVAVLPAPVRQSLALGPFCAMGLVAFADGRFDAEELDGIARWIEERVADDGLISLLWDVEGQVLEELRQRARNPESWQADLDASVQSLVSWVEPRARAAWVDVVREAAATIAEASSDGGLLAEYFAAPVSDDERMVLTSIDQVLEAALLAR